MSTSTAYTARQLAYRFAPLLLIAATVGHFYWYIDKFAVNMPFQDDILDVLRFVSEVVKSEDWQSTLAEFHNQHNNHRTTASRLFFYAVYLAQGEVDFRVLSAIANLALLPILGLLFLRVRQHEYRWLILLPAALILFQLRSYAIVLVTQAVFAWVFVFLYGFICIFALHRVNVFRFSLAALCAVLASFTLASGQLVWLVGLASLLQQSLLLKSCSIRYSMAWVLIALVALVPWYWGLENPADPTFLAQFLPDNIIGAPILEAIAHHLLFFICSLGSAISENNFMAAATLGAVLLILLTFFTVTAHRREDLRLELCGWYAVLTAAAIAYGRASFYNVDYGMASRFSYSSVMLFAIVWVLLALRIRKHQVPVLMLAILLAGMQAVASYRTYATALETHINSRISAFNRHHYQVFMADQSKYVEQASDMGIYRQPTRPQPLRHSGDDKGKEAKHPAGKIP